MMFSSLTGPPGDALIILRAREPGLVDLTATFSMNQVRFDQWLSRNPVKLESARSKLAHFLNRPGLAEMHAIDANMYVVLGVDSCKRGPPLLPLPAGSTQEPDVTVRTEDDPVPLGSWIRMPPGRFHLAAFVNRCAANLGLDLEAYDSLDGQPLVHYQCVVRSDKWQLVQDQFLAAFQIQRRAYRRMNGGSIAPNVRADVGPRFVIDEKLVELGRHLAREQTAAQHHVKRTFLEVDDSAKTTPRTGPSSDSSESDRCVVEL